MYSCNKCQINFPTLAEYFTHMKNTNHKFQCSNCNTEFQNRTDLEKHLRNKICSHKNPSHFQSLDSFAKEQEHESLGDELESDLNSFDAIGLDRLFEKSFTITGYKDPIKCFARFRPRIKTILMKFLLKSTVKYFCTMKIRMFKVGGDGERVYDSVGFFGGNFHCLTREDLDDQLDQTSNNLNSNFENFSANGSGWVLERVEKITLKVAKNIDIGGGTYIPTPPALRKRRGLINVRNLHNLKCFEYSLLAAYHNDELKSKASRPSSYKEWVGKQFDFSEFPLPMHPSMIPKFEKKYHLSINLYHIESEGQQITPLLISKKRVKDPINMLLIEDKKNSKYHYTWIKKMRLY